jgi:Ion channel
MYDHWMANALVVLVTAMSVALAVLVHYEGLALLNQRLVRVHARRRRKVLLGVYGVILLHVMEIWLFGIALWMLLQMPHTGSLNAMAPVPFLDAVYLSAETFTTVGFGDLSPQGAIRFLAGTEALTGFILITWSASFLYLEMEQYWRKSGG